MTSKSHVLSILEQNRGSSVSGEEIADKMQISRAAVWKAVRELKKEGYQISAATNKGYSLSPDSDVLSVAGMLPYLHDKNIACRIHVAKSLDSTNQTAKKMALDGAPDKTAVLAEEQTAGRGRMGRSFFSPANKGIYLSIILRPRLSLADSLLITSAASVAACRAIKSVTGIDTRIKWVNDILVNDKKVCGILTEAVSDFESGSIECVIIGIGINFNTPGFLFPPEIQDTAGSLYEAGLSGGGRNRLAAEIINQVLEIIGRIADREFLAEYKKRSAVLQKEIQLVDSGKIVNAFVMDIDDNGSLVIKKEDGSISVLNSGEVSVRRIS